MKTRVSREFSTNGYATTYAYDAAGNLTNVTYPAGTASITNGFDALNRLTNRLDAVGQSRYTYTVLGNGQRTFAEDGPWASDDVTVTNRYGLRAGLTLAQPTGQFAVTNAWDASRRWSVVGGTAGTFTYDYAGSAGVQPAALTLPGGGYLTNTYDTLARLTRTELRTSGGAILNSHSYLLNAAHQRTLLGRTNSAVSNWNGYVNALYDAAGQLTNAWTYQPNGTPVTTEQWSYGYDAAQNLSKRTNYTTVETFAVNALNQLTAIPDSTPTYDRRGNLTSRYFGGGNWIYLNYTYDAENQLTSVATDTAYTWAGYRFKAEFGYDGQGRVRTYTDYYWTNSAWNLNTQTRYVYDGLLLVQERNSANTPLVTYTRGRDLSGSLAGAGGIGGLLARSHGYSGGNWSYDNFYHADGNGNVTALVNSAGTLQAIYKYDPYGRYLGQSGALATANVMRFSSKPWFGFQGSTTSGLYYYGYRFYDPYLQRWVNRDPMEEEGGVNVYTPISNSPFVFIDPLGLEIQYENSEDGKGAKNSIAQWKCFPMESKLRHFIEELEKSKRKVKIKKLKGVRAAGKRDKDGKLPQVTIPVTTHHTNYDSTINIDFKYSYWRNGVEYLYPKALAEEILHAYYWTILQEGDTSNDHHGNGDWERDKETIFAEIDKY